jgi:hypothetical protein
MGVPKTDYAEFESELSHYAEAGSYYITESIPRNQAIIIKDKLNTAFGKARDWFSREVAPDVRKLKADVKASEDQKKNEFARTIKSLREL